MKKYFYLFFSLFMLTASMSIVSCSKDSGSSEEDPISKITGVWKAGTYTLSLFDNATFEAVDAATGKQFAGDYIYANDILELYGVTTRAFSLEPGKTYRFQVELSDGKLKLTNTETKETYEMEYTGPTEHKETTYDAAGEKKYIEQTLRQLESYFDSKEWEEFTTVVKELDETKESSEMKDMIESLINEKKISSGEYEDVIEKVIILSNLKGQYEASYGGKWIETGKEGACKMTYTAKDTRKWVLEASCTGNLGEVFFDSDRDYYWNYNTQTSHVTKYNKYIQIPQAVSVKLTCNGAERAVVNVKIDKFTNAYNREISLIGQTSGSFNVMLKPAGDALTAEGSFNYVNKENTSVNTTVKKGNVTLVDVQVEANVDADKHKEANDGTFNVVATILNKLTIKASSTSVINFVEAMEDADDNKYDEAKVKEYAQKASSFFSASVSNGPNADKVADIILCMKKDVKTIYSYNYTTGTSTSEKKNYWTVVPGLMFSDGSTYSIEDYFTENYFKGVIDKAKDIVKGFKKLID